MSAAPTFAPDTPFIEVLRAWATYEPDRAAVTDDERSLSRAELDASSDRLARAYAARGVTAGSFVTIALPDGVEFFEAVVAVWKLGATPQPVSHRIPPHELDRVLDLARPSLVVGRDVTHTASVPAGFVAEPGPSEPVAAVVSSAWKAPMSGGSTGAPKLIVSTLEARYGSLASFAPLIRMRPEGVSVIPTPLSHNMGLLFGTLTLLTGGEVVIMPRFEPAGLLRLLDSSRATWTVAVPTMLHRMARLDGADPDVDLSRLGAIAVGAAACPQWLKEYWAHRLGPERMVEFYSTTENQVIVIADGQTWLDRPGSVGRVVVGELDVRDEQGEPVADGEVGELWMRREPGSAGPYRYLGAEPQRRGDWDTVGDIGRIEDGYVYLADRKVDMVVVGGSNVYPAEVEAALDAHPLVLSSVVVGVPDDEYGEVLHAVVQTSADVDDTELVVHLRERLLPYKVPRVFDRADSPLRDDAGKVRRSAWRERIIAARVP
jgi:bile acid-coenzyme A ligase